MSHVLRGHKLQEQGRTIIIPTSPFLSTSLVASITERLSGRTRFKIWPWEEVFLQSHSLGNYTSALFCTLSFVTVFPRYYHTPNQHSTEKLTLTCSCTHVHVRTNMLILPALIPYCAERKLFLKFKKNNHTYFCSETFGVRHHQKAILLPNYKTYGDAG